MLLFCTIMLFEYLRPRSVVLRLYAALTFVCRAIDLQERV